MEKLNDNQKDQGNNPESDNLKEDSPFECILFPLSTVKFSNINDINSSVQKELYSKFRNSFEAIG